MFTLFISGIQWVVNAVLVSFLGHALTSWISAKTTIPAVKNTMVKIPIIIYLFIKIIKALYYLKDLTITENCNYVLLLIYKYNIILILKSKLMMVIKNVLAI